MSINEKINRELGKQKIAKLFKFAEKQGVIKRGWSWIDYARNAIKNCGWESTCISGTKGSLKSNLLMQHGKAIYGTIPLTEQHMITEKKQLLKMFQDAIDNEYIMPWLSVDDAAALFPKSMYFTHRKLYSKLQASWETVRTVMSNFEFTCVLKHKVAAFILEDITGDIKCYDGVFTNNGTPIKSHCDYRRWMWLRNIKDPTTDIAKLILVEDIPFPATPDAFKIDKELSEGQFISGGITYKGYEYYEKRVCLTGIETSDFRNYWNRRLAITKKSFEEFSSIFEETPTTPKLTPEERAEINRNNGKKGLETQKRNRFEKIHRESGEVAK